MSRRLAILRVAAIVAATLAALASLVRLRLRSTTVLRPGRHARGGSLSVATGVEADRIGRRWAMRLARRMGLRIVVEGELPDGPVAIVANHLGYLDVVALWCLVPGAFVARADVAHWPLIGVASRLVGTVSIDRTRKRDLLRVIPELSAILASGRNVIFFPEGTSSPGETVLSFRSSLFEAAARRGVPVVGVSLQYETPQSAPIAAWSVCWWGRMTFPRHVFALLSIPHVVARIRFSRPLRPSQDRKMLCRLARESVVKKFIPTAPTPFRVEACAAQANGARA
jgi:1-acyl-sn-glycerol-3-phosphate acyltransferase